MTDHSRHRVEQEESPCRQERILCKGGEQESIDGNMVLGMGNRVI